MTGHHPNSCRMGRINSCYPDSCPQTTSGVVPPILQLKQDEGTMVKAYIDKFYELVTRIHTSETEDILVVGPHPVAIGYWLEMDYR